MSGFKSYESAAITIAGIELLRRIHKNQFALSALLLKGQAAPTIWNAVAVPKYQEPRSVPAVWTSLAICTGTKKGIHSVTSVRKSMLPY
jgi:hypothetical protein